MVSTRSSVSGTKKKSLGTNLLEVQDFYQHGSVILRVPNRFFGIRDLGYFNAGIRDFEGKGGQDSGS